MEYIVLAALLVLGGLIYWKITEARKQRAAILEAEARKQREELTVQLRIWLKEINQAESAFSSYLSLTSGYFAHYTLRTWIAQYQALAKQVALTKYPSSNLAPQEIDKIYSFMDHIHNGEAARDKFNAEFVPVELGLYDRFLSDIEGRSLDVQQRTAIVSDEDRNLVVAGAGSGKTTTIIGKVKYVLDRYHTSPERILLISFTNKSATTLAERIGNAGVKPRTFHKFGKDVICTVDGKQPSLYDDSQFPEFIRATFRQRMQASVYAEQVTTYFLNHLKPSKPPEDFKTQGEYIQHLKDYNFRPYKLVSWGKNGKITYNRQVVKSVEECRIANFLFVNGIEYEYEAPYQFETASRQHAQWKPDFTIKAAGKTIYLEHFGVNRKGTVPAFFAKEGQSVESASLHYQQKMEWARATSRQHGTILLETYSYEMAENTLFENLSANLRKHGVVLQPKTPDEIWEIINASADDEVRSFHQLLQTFISHLKSNDCSIQQARELNVRSADKSQHERNRHFLDIIEPLFDRYQQELTRRQELDFDDLINKAAAYIRSSAYPNPFDYIIIDEFQDISNGRARLIHALLDQHPHCKLFCVGDDWQSIYRFAGSDLALFKDFKNRFGFSLQSKIETTYRFHNPLISLSSTFITRNPNQTPKQLRSGSTGKQTKSRIVYNDGKPGEQDDTAVLQQVLDGLITTVSGLKNKEILLLSRYSFDLKRVKNTSHVFTIDHAANTVKYGYHDDQGRSQSLHIPFMTVHKAKGLEADIVIVLNCNSGKYGFPSQMSDDPILNLLLSKADQFENGEERRLFYVAMTRAREEVILVTDPAFKSKFITELEAGSKQTTLKKCPQCSTADLEKRSGVTNGKPWAFYGCTNYAYGCEYKEWV